MPQDVMHVLFEGVLPLETRLMLSSFLESGYVSLDLLNKRVSHFTYGRAEARNSLYKRLPSLEQDQVFTYRVC